MRRSTRFLAVVLGLTLVAASGSAFAQSDTGKEPVQTQKQQRKHHHQHCHHKQQCKCGNGDRAGFNQEEHHHGFGPYAHFTTLTAKLNLSDQQKTRMKDLFTQNRPAVKPVFAKLITEKRALRELIQSGSADEAAIRAQAAKVAVVEADLAVQHAQLAKQFRAILTPEQIEKFKAVQKERGARFDTYREHMGEKCDKTEVGK